jgi:activator of HSP90 ATPase
MKVSFEIQFKFVCSAQRVYEAWLHSASHSEMTGGEALCKDEIGYSFSAWDGYISGTNLELKPNKEIKQSWRTTEFNASDDDSEIFITLEETNEGCLVTLLHTNIPGGQPDYKQGWMDHYFIPMSSYFN